MSDEKRPKASSFLLTVVPNADGTMRVRVKKQKTAKKAKKTKKTKKTSRTSKA